MGRGTELAEGISIDEGQSPAGVRSIIHFQGTEVIFQRQQDMEPILRHVQEMRERNEGRPWGTGKEVGHVPEIFMPLLNAVGTDPAARRKWRQAFFRANPMLCAYPAYCK